MKELSLLASTTPKGSEMATTEWRRSQWRNKGASRQVGRWADWNREVNPYFCVTLKGDLDWPSSFHVETVFPLK